MLLTGGPRFRELVHTHNLPTTQWRWMVSQQARELDERRCQLEGTHLPAPRREEREVADFVEVEWLAVKPGEDGVGNGRQRPAAGLRTGLAQGAQVQAAAAAAATTVGAR